jgi:hypothetical protein
MLLSGNHKRPPPVAPPPPPPPTGTLWSDPATWGGSLPLAGDNITIPHGTAVVLDVTTPILNSLTISGDLIVSTSVDTELRVQQLIGSSTGRYLSGTSSTPNLRVHTRTMYGTALVGNNPGPSHSGNTPTASYPGDSGGINGSAGAIRGFLMSDGFQYKIYGFVPSVTEARVNLSAIGGPNSLPNGTTVIPLDRGVDWKAGDQIIIGPTGFYIDPVTHRTEKFTVVADTNGLASVTITPGLGFSRWAKVQYLNDNNTLTVDASTGFTTGTGGLRATTNIPATLDQRARVLHVSRRHKVQGFNDAELTNKRFGSHDMVMQGSGAPTSVIILQGVQWDNAGQGGLQGRYPFHFHMTSYVIATGAVLGDYPAGNAVIQDCTFTNSMNRAVTLHGCRGVQVRRCYAWNIYGHAFFFEDASEMLNTLEDCRVYRTNDPGTGDTPAQIAYAPRGYRIKKHDGTFSWDDLQGPAGIWITNMNNNVNRNVCGDTVGPGIWNSISRTSTSGATAACWGVSSKVNIFPEAYAPLTWDSNEGHSGRVHGREGLLSQADEEGNLGSPGKLRPTSDGTMGGPEVPWVQSNDFYWKNGGGAITFGSGSGYHHTVYIPVYTGFRFADNFGFSLHGTTQFGSGTGFTFIEKSLNDEGVDYGIPNGAVSYHGTFHIRDLTAIGYAPTTPAPLGRDARSHLWMRCFFGGFDNYTQPYFSFSKDFTNWRIGVGFAMYMTPGPNIQNLPPFNTWSGGSMFNGSPWNAMCTAFYDHWGTMFNAGAGITCIPDMPFFTTGQTTTALTANGIPIGMRAATTQQIGIYPMDNLGSNAGIGPIDTVPNDISRDRILWQRVDTTALADVSLATYDTDPTGGQNFPGGICSIPIGGAVRFTMPSTTHAIKRGRYQFIKGFDNVADFVYVGLPWANAAPLTSVGVIPSNIYTAGTGTAVPSAASKAILLASVTTAYWRDTTNNVLWVKLFQPSGPFNQVTVGNYSQTEDYNFALEVRQ